DIVGGLTVAGIVPEGWSVPAGTAVTLPPRTLACVKWPAGEGLAFVAENPSVLAAALDAACTAPCVSTNGNPARETIAALADLGAAGWTLMVRSDFDDVGLGNVTAMLATIAGSRPWRMTASDYRAALHPRSRIPVR